MSKQLIREAHQIANIALFRITARDYMRRLREILRKVEQWLRRERRQIES